MHGTPPYDILTRVVDVQGDRSSPEIEKLPQGYPAEYDENWLAVIFPDVIILGESPNNLKAAVENGLVGALDAVQSARTKTGGFVLPEAAVKRAPSRS